MKELQSYYSYYFSLSQGVDSHVSLPSLSIQYKDFALWQRSYLSGERLNNQLNYWKNKLTGYGVLNLITDKPRPNYIDYKGGDVYFELDETTSIELRELAKELKVSLFSLLLAGYYLMLKVYSNQDDIVVGTPIANRHYSQIENLIGFFVNSLALRTKIKAKASVKEFIQQIGDETVEAQLYQDLPYEKLVEELEIDKDTSRHPIFQVMFGTQNFGKALYANEQIENDLINLLEPYVTRENIYNIAKFDICTFINDSQTKLKGNFNYASSLYTEATITRFIETYTLILKQMAKLAYNNQKQEQTRIYHLDYLSREQYEQLIYSWNQTYKDYPANKTIQQLFEEQVLKAPNSIALVYEGKQVTYQELNSRANQLAHYLRTMGVSPDSFVAIAVDRSLEMIVGILGILKAGGAYIPLDPSYPQERLQFMLEDTGVPILLTHSSLKSEFKSYRGNIVTLNLDWDIIQQQPGTNPALSTLPSNLACIIYTSASSGKPKAVLIEHRLMFNRFAWMWENYPFEDKEVCCQKTSLSFVDAVWEIFGPLLKGLKLVLIPSLIINDPLQFIKLMHRESISRLVLVPSLLQTILEQDNKLLSHYLKNLQICVVSGEAISPTTSIEFTRTLGHYTKLLNLYGSTEVGADVTYYEMKQTAMDDNWDGKVSIGRPISNIKTYILDEYMNPVPIGVNGEIYVGGAGLARGYLYRSALTAEKFVANPFATDTDIKEGKNLRLYRMGDLAKYLPDGNIEYLGRIDDQVKIRGFRIELGEIESIIKAHRDVAKVAVIAREDEPGDKKVVAYVVPQKKITFSLLAEATFSSSSGEAFSILNGEVIKELTEDLRNYLTRLLPDYMIPSFFVYLDQVPLTANGKIDHKPLPAPDLTLRILGDEYIAPRNAIEHELSTIWKKILKVETSWY